jgi:hypothetical protein
MRFTVEEPTTRQVATARRSISTEICAVFLQIEPVHFSCGCQGQAEDTEEVRRLILSMRHTVIMVGALQQSQVGSGESGAEPRARLSAEENILDK